MVLAMLKMGFHRDEVLAMPEAEMMSYIDAYNEILSPQKGKTWSVKRPSR